MLTTMLDQILDRMFRWNTKNWGSKWQALKPHLGYIGLPFLLPWVLFPALAIGSEAQWWQGDAWIVRALLAIMLVFAVVFGGIYLFLTPVLILGIWRGKVKIPRYKQRRMQFNFVAFSLLYGLIASWGWRCLMGHSHSFLLHCGLIVYFGMYVANLVLFVFERRAARVSAVC